MKKIMRMLSALLSFVLLCTMLPAGALTALAAEAKGNVIFSYDFENLSAGELLAQNRDDVNGWYTVTMKPESAPITVAEEKGYGKYAKIENISDAYSGPKLMKYINLGAMSNVRVSYDYKGDRQLGFNFSDGVTTYAVKTTKPNDWTTVVIDINVNEATYQATIGGEKGEKMKFDMFANPSQIQFNFTCGVNAGETLYIDNVLITTTDAISPLAAQDKSTAVHSGNQKYIEAAQKEQEAKLNVTFEPAPKEGIRVPEGQNIIVIDDCESYGEVLTYENWSIVGNKTYVNPGKDGGNQFIAIENTDTVLHTPRFNRPLKNLGLNTMTIELDFAANPAMDLIVYVQNAEKSTQVARPEESYRDGKWHKVKVEVNFANKQAVCYIDGAAVKTTDLTALMSAENAWDTMEIQISAQLNAGAKGRLDNTVAYTPDSVANSVFDYQNNINWDMVKTDNPTGLVDIIREAHPRIIINDWDVIREKIKNDYWCGVWWTSIKNVADSYVAEDTKVTYRVNARGNIQETSQEIRIKSVVLAFVAGVTGERKYAEQLYKILKDVHDTFPDWSESLALLSANFIASYAWSYDWAYDVFTPQERADVLRMFLNRGVNIAVQGYEQKLAEAYVTMMQRGNNQTSTANRANIFAAIAIATDYPAVAEYLLDKASTGMPNMFAEFYPDGAFVETTDYWNASATDVIQAISALEACIQPGTRLPARLDWANSIPGFVNTGDFPIYYNGANTSFNYGDTTSSFISSISFLYLSSRYDEPKYAWYEMTRNQTATPFTTRRIPFAIAWYDPEKATCKPGEFPLDKFYVHPEDGGVNGMSMRSSWEDEDMLFAAMQGGDNGAMHQNPSLGTFVLDYGDVRWFLLTGKNSKTGTYTIASRYDGPSTDIWHKRTESNNTLIINPDETAGQDSDAFAPIIRHDSDANSAYGILDISDVREDVQFWNRGMMMYNNRERVIIRDEITTMVPSEIYWFGHTNAQIDVAADGQSAMMTIGDKQMYVRLNEAPAGAVLAVRDISPLPTSPNPETQQGEYLPEYSGDKTLYVHMTDITSANIELEFIPIREGEAIPTDTPACKALKDWSLEGGQMFTAQAIGNAVALKLGTPVSFAKGQRTYVDAANKDVVPFTENSRTLVPVRYIAESFGATVGWDDATQAVTVDYLNKHISLQIGSNQMFVNGEVVTLDTAANTYNSRTFIPLRALVEVLGKTVFWDDRGLIIISDVDMGYSAETLDAACDYLDIRIFAGEDEITFDPAKTTYYIKGGTRPICTEQNNNAAAITVTDGSPATVTIDGKVYTIHFEG